MCTVTAEKKTAGFCLKKSIILMGIKHCGKTTQGKLLSEHFNCSFQDTDTEILKETGKSARQIYIEDGEKTFKNREADICKKMNVLAQQKPIVIATGGGVCSNPEAIRALRCIDGVFIYMKINEAVAAGRIVREAVFSAHKIENIPAYIAKKNPQSEKDVRDIFHEFYAVREQQYKAIADYTVDVSDYSKKANAQKIIKLLTIAGFTVSVTAAGISAGSAAATAAFSAGSAAT